MVDPAALEPPAAGNGSAIALPPVDLEAPAAGLVDQITARENAKDAIAAEQARLMVALDQRIRAERAAKGVPAARQGEGIAKQVGLARRESPNYGALLLGRAKVLVNQMPHTLQALGAGRLNEHRAAILVRETDCLNLEHRAVVDEELAGNPDRLHGLGNRQLEAEAKRAACRLDPHAVVKRAAKAEADRYVSSRPEPDVMVSVRTLLPVVQGVAVMAALQQEADRLANAGDPRTRGQVMADTVFERVTGRSTADPAALELQLVMTDRALLQGEREPAWLTGYGIVPAQYARDLIRLPQDPQELATAATGGNQAGQSPPPRNPSGPPGSGFGQKAPPGAGTGQKAPPAGTEPGWKTAREQARLVRLRNLKVGGVEDVWIRRLYTAPGTGQLLGMDSKARKFPDGIRRMVMARDAFCGGPWCDAPIRHIDHIVAWSEGGPTTLANGQGLCERCNHAKEADGWSTKPIDAPRHSVETTTPTGHTYTSTAPPLPGTLGAVPETGGMDAPEGTEPRAIQAVRHALAVVNVAMRQMNAADDPRPGVNAEKGWAVVRSPWGHIVGEAA
ncbi:HNH endonuclease [Arthrobacter sulfonylureivorans]|uniref:HNH endonuclease n=1 Tax=Arthrobacter sulfonylureivorans TaxID=2486855 RepID=A0ABY3W387_9MICC|nr:HNH endonuclease signature motif containing protein [Arthrobacter sulfonylureivorans]UNK44565.1 HNH endonuclease [Arthrobacter sulfonylureivorans]